MEVVKLEREPYEPLVETLEKLLEQARSGELRGVAFVTLKPGSFTGCGWTAAPDVSIHVLTSGVDILHHRVVNSTLETFEYDKDMPPPR